MGNSVHGHLPADQFYRGRHASVARRRGAAYEWLRARFRDNVPYDELAERVLTATSREGRGYEEWADEYAAVLKEENEGKFPATYTVRRTLDLFWQRRMDTDVDHAIRVGHSFLGLRLQCARCHRHPHDVWTQEDLLSFANFFMRVPHFNSNAGSWAKPVPATVALAKEKAAKLPDKVKATFEKQFGVREIFTLSEGPLNSKGGLRIQYQQGRFRHRDQSPGHAVLSGIAALG